MSPARAGDIGQHFFAWDIALYHAGYGEFYQYCVKPWAAGLRRGSPCGGAHHHAECDAAVRRAHRRVHPGHDAYHQL